MFSKIELKLAYGLAICFFFVGALCYAAFPAKTRSRAVNAMTPMKGTKKLPNAPMLFISSVPAVMRDMAPARLKRNVPLVMSGKPVKQSICRLFSTALKFCRLTKRVRSC